MATTAVSQKKAYYRQARINPPSSQNLQQLLSQALNGRERVKDRLEATDASAEAFRVLGHYSKVNGMLCGALLSFERGSYQLVVEDDPNATQVKMNAIAPPNAGAVQQQFVPGLLVFACFENHVVLVQSASLRATAFEQHLAWLLRDKAKVLSPEQGIVLADEPQKATVARIRKSHVKAITIGAPLMDPVKETEDGAGSDSRAGLRPDGKITEAQKFSPNKHMLNMLRPFLPADKFSKLKLAKDVFDSDLEVWLHIKYPHRKRVIAKDTMKLIDDLAIAMRNLDDHSLRLQLGDGTQVKGNDLKIVTNMPFETVDGTPHLDKLYTDLTTWVTNLIRDGAVSA